MKFSDPRPSNSQVSHTALFFFALVVIANTVYVTNVSHKNAVIAESAAESTVGENPIVSSNGGPEVFIYRRTKKTGSTSMVEAILKCLIPEGYAGLYNKSDVLSDILRMEVHKPSPRKFVIGSHNDITREHTRNRSTVIADTVVDGYKQMTSFCRYIRRVEKCDSDEMRDCLRANSSRSQLVYRWAGRSKEDWETFIDLPLSAEHPAISATIFRRVFPHINLDVGHNNKNGSSCEEIPSIRKVYNSIYKGLDNQVELLRRRMLTAAGYPSEMTGYSVAQLLNAAEKSEQAKYNLTKHEPTAYNGDFHLFVKGTSKSYQWYISKDGKLLFKKRQRTLPAQV